MNGIMSALQTVQLEVLLTNMQMEVNLVFLAPVN